MTTDVRCELVTVLRSAMDDVEPPPLDLSAIMRRGRRRRYRTRAAAAAAAVLAAGVAGTLFIAVPRGDGQPTAPSTASAIRLTAITRVRDFYHGYALAQVEGPASVQTLVSSYTTGWYRPVLQTAVVSTANPVGCAERNLSAATMAYEWVGVVGGQAVVLTRWRTQAKQVKYNLVSTVPKTAAITGITCVTTRFGPVTSATSPTPAGQVSVRQATTLVFSGYLKALKTGRLSPSRPHYAGQFADAAYFGLLASSAPRLSYDPVLCRPGAVSARDWSFTVARTVRTVAGRLAAVVTVRPQAREPILTVVERRAGGLAITNIACLRP